MPQVHAVFEHVCGVAVAQHVWGDARGYAGSFCCGSNDVGDGGWAVGLVFWAFEQVAFRAVEAEVFFEEWK